MQVTQQIGQALGNETSCVFAIELREPVGRISISFSLIELFCPYAHIGLLSNTAFNYPTPSGNLRITQVSIPFHPISHSHKSNS